MSEILSDLGNACIVVLGIWTLIRYARGWRLEWRPPVHIPKNGDQ